MTERQAVEAVLHPLFFGDFMVRTGMADGSVAGSLSTTGDVIKAGLHCIGLKEGIKDLSRGCSVNDIVVTTVFNAVMGAV